MKEKEAELQRLAGELKTQYLFVSESYRTMSRFADELRLKVAQAGIEHALRRAAEIREQMTVLRAEIASDWSNNHKQYKGLFQD